MPTTSSRSTTSGCSSTPPRWSGAASTCRSRRSRAKTASTRKSSRPWPTWAAIDCGSAPRAARRRVLDLMKRRTNAERVRAMVHLLQKYGIEVGMFIMLGYDGEERDRPGGHRRAPEGSRPGHVPDHGRLPDQRHALLPDRRRQGGRPPAPGRTGSDRDYTVAGPPFAALLPLRHALDGQRGGAPPPRATARAAATRAWRVVRERQVGRLGMLLTEREVEHA